MPALLHDIAAALVVTVAAMALVNLLFPVRLSDSDWERWS